MKKSTRAVHAGTRTESNLGGVSTPVMTSSAIRYLDDVEIRYPRYLNTLNNQVVVDKLCALEGADDGIVTSSGMAAISSVLFGLLQPGDHAIMLEGLYGGTHDLATREFERLGISWSMVPADIDEIGIALRDETRLLFVESPTNPLLTVLDLEALTRAIPEPKVVKVIDGTFSTPILQNPLALGFDLVVHSGTKYLGGHSDLCCGAVCGRGDLLEIIRNHALMHGPSLNAQDLYLLERSLKTLDLRVRKQSFSAGIIAPRLLEAPAIERVWYPGLASHPGHRIAGKQMEGFGGIISFELASGIDPEIFLRRLCLVQVAVSLGGVDSTICQPVATSHQKMPEPERERLGITASLLRLSVGIEDPEDLLADLLQALEP